MLARFILIISLVLILSFHELGTGAMPSQENTLLKRTAVRPTQVKPPVFGCPKGSALKKGISHTYCNCVTRNKNGSFKLSNLICVKNDATCKDGKPEVCKNHCYDKNGKIVPIGCTSSWNHLTICKFCLSSSSQGCGFHRLRCAISAWPCIWGIGEWCGDKPSGVIPRVVMFRYQCNTSNAHPWNSRLLRNTK